MLEYPIFHLFCKQPFIIVFWEHSILEKHYYNKALNMLELYTVFSQPEHSFFPPPSGFCSQNLKSHPALQVFRNIGMFDLLLL